MYRLTTDELGRSNGRRYFLTVAVEPNPSGHVDFDPYQDAEAWYVTVHFPGALPNERDTQIARIDTRHGRPHFDKLYLPPQPKEWLPVGYTLARAERRLATGWREFAARYDSHHGP